MKGNNRQRFLVALLVGGALSLAAANENDQPNTPWKVSGDLEEACSCHAACPCWFKSQPSRMTCDGVQAIFTTIA